jgi:hypothetical protein
MILRRSRAAEHGGERGLALVTVLLVLLALLVLSAPFLMTARNASKAGTQLADRAQARLALDAATRHARAALGESHPAVDRTPYFDDEEELTALPPLDPKFLDAHDAAGVMWDAKIEDVAGRIDLNSAPPQVIANLLGATTRLVKEIDDKDVELDVASAFGLPRVGYVWVDRELIQYREIEGQTLKKLVRGVAASTDGEGKATEAGPTPPAAHGVGAIVIDQRAFAPSMWRTITPDGRPRELDASEQIRDTLQLAMGIDAEALAVVAEREAELAKLPPEQRKFDREVELARARRAAGFAFSDPVVERGTTYGGVRGGRAWQRATRMRNEGIAGQTGILSLDERRWFAPGSTVEITDGRNTELGIVFEVVDQGIRLMDPLRNDYSAFSAEVRALARRPVNVNVAPAGVIETVLANLQLRGRTDRVTRDEAREMAALIVVSRPFEGFEDFLRRIVLPAAGLEKLPSDAPVRPPALEGPNASIIDAYDAVAIYSNALNANDSTLAYSTMPFSFTSRDVFDLELRAAVNAPNGVERVSMVREQVEMVVPQRDLLQVWARQEDFDDAFRLDVDAPWWCTGPNAVQRWDGGASPPSKLWPHFGTVSGMPYLPGVTELPPTENAGPPVPEHVFASREDTGWAQLWASREPTTLAGIDRRHVEHFDHETRDFEGRYLPDEPLRKATSSTDVEWTANAEPRLRAFDFSLWIKPRELGNATLLDLGRSSFDTDRVTLSIENQDLVLRVRDAGGDITDPALSPNDFKEWGEARFAVAPGDGPGLLADTWTHVAVDVRGTRPSQIHMTVDGRTIGVRKPGLTRLTGAVNDTSTTLPVESTEGFPEKCVVRIGHELIECRVQGNALVATPQAGIDAGFGGRMARVRWTFANSASGDLGEPDPNVVAGIVTNHAIGTPLELYGYAAALKSAVPPVEGRLMGTVGPFRVGIVQSVVLSGGSPNGESIDVQFTNNAGLPVVIPIGNGFEGASSEMTGLVLEEADEPGTPMILSESGFHQGPGYAALMSVARPDWTTVTGGSKFGGIEIVEYSGYSGSTLNIVRRGVLGTGNGTNGNAPDWTAKAFVVDWVGPFSQLNSELKAKVFVIPISLPVSGGSGAFGFPVPSSGGAELAQITETGANAANTEWVRYDQVEPQHLVRNEYGALENTRAHLVGRPPTDPPLPGGPGGPPTPPGTPASTSSTASPGASAPASGVQQSSSSGSSWEAVLGLDQDEGPVSKVARTRLQFRGVFGTFTHTHEASVPLHPVWRIYRFGIDGGEPGRYDAVYLMSEDGSDLGFASQVHRAWRPLDRRIYEFQANGLVPSLLPGESESEDVDQAAVWVALSTKLPTPLVPSAVPSSSTAQMDTRILSRVLKHPSGERPREVDRVAVGEDLRGGQGMAATADEIVLHSAQFADSSGPSIRGASFFLMDPFGEGAQAMRVAPRSLRIPLGRYGEETDFLNQLPQDAGLLLIGDEIVCYDSRLPDTGTFTVPRGGRGLLGTTEGTHEAGECAVFLEQYAVGVLSGQIGAGDSALPLTDTNGFPPSGTVLVGNELIHYTRIAGGALDMPRRSSKPGEKDGRGDGLFRGRFGTAAEAHVAGTPVILFPFRYWDRWTERSDAPELGYFGLCLDQPNAFWRTSFWTAEDPSSGQVRLEVLQRESNSGRPDPPWDGEPGVTDGLTLLTDGMPRNEGNPIGHQADLLEWRVHVRYAVGAFDSLTGLSHGWKQTPRLRIFGAEYLGPDLVLRRVAR